MVVTALVISLAVLGLSAWVVRGVLRVLLWRRSRLVRLLVALAGLGYGLPSALRREVFGALLLVLGGTAAVLLLADARSLLIRAEARFRRSGSAFTSERRNSQRDQAVAERFLDRVAIGERRDCAALGRSRSGRRTKGDLCSR